MHICIYEDQSYRQFYPLTLMRPAYLLRAGILPIHKRIEAAFSSSAVSFACRDLIAPHVAQSCKDYPVNIIKHEDCDVLFINGRVRDLGNLLEKVEQATRSSLFTSSGKTIAVLFKQESISRLPSVTTPTDFFSIYKAEVDTVLEVDCTTVLYEYLWEIMADIRSSIVSDYDSLISTFDKPDRTRLHDGASLINESAIQLGDDVTVMPSSVIDATDGPVFIGNNTRIEPHASIVGPCYIGANSVVLAGKIVHSSIGHTCRVGGEVEESIFHSYVNKYHDGFIGHSYVGSWVNFGAMTTNSDLKNNYSTIRMTLNGDALDSGSIKVGSFIGDHTKFGIGTLLNTGINIGVSCNVFGAGLIADKEIASFQWGGTGNWQEYKIEKAVETAQRVLARRNCDLTNHEEALLMSISQKSDSSEGTFVFEASDRLAIE